MDGDGAVVGDDAWTSELWFRGILGLLPAGDDALAGVGGFGASGLDEPAVEPVHFLADVVVGFVI